MGKIKNDRIGEETKNSAGFTMRIVKYKSNKQVKVLIVETGEEKWTRYDNFKKGYVKADLDNYPLKIDGQITFKQFKFFGGATILIVIATLISILISVFK